MIINKISARPMYRTDELVIECPKGELSSLIKVLEASDIRTGENYDLTLLPHSEKRSLDANSYCWKLCDLIARKIQSTKEEVYRIHVTRVGPFDDVAVQTSRVPVWCKNWESQGDGWIAEVRPDCKIKGCTKVRTYYGSSVYNSAEMSRLIDDIVDEAVNLGIPTTLSEEEREKLC